MTSNQPGHPIASDSARAWEVPLLDLNGAILDAVGDGIFGLTNEGITTFVNPAATRMTGWTAEELIGHVQHPILHHSRKDGTPFLTSECPIYATCKSGVIHQQQEDLFWRKDGSSFPVSYTATPLRTNGIVSGTVVVFRDISQHKKRELEHEDRQQELELLVRRKTEELRQINIQLSSILEAASLVGIIAADLNGIITLFNEGAERLLGYSKSEVVLKTTPAIFHLPAEVEARGRELSRLYGRPINGNEVFVTLAKGALPQPIEWTYVRKNGTHIPVHLAVTPMVDENSSIIGYLGVAYDLSERKNSEETLRAAKAAAESANRAKSDFLATMSHEIRTPMNGIVGMASLLLDSNLDPVQRKRALTLRESGDALLSVLNDILDFSKLEASKLELEMTDCNLRHLVEGAADLMAFKAQEKGLEFTVFIDPEVKNLRHADPSRLRQILLNLIGNAIKFTAQGEVSLRVTDDPTAGPESVYFEVSDTGIGVPADKHHLLFERFTQADASTSRQYGGSGLGLSIVRGLVSAMGGRLGFTSHEGRGSTFWFSVAMPVHAEVRRRPVLSFAGKRILVVDDCPTSRRVLHDYLTLWRCDPEEVASSEACLQRLQDQTRRPFDALIIDREMPHFDGDRLGLLIRSDERLAAIPIVLLTPLSDVRIPGPWELRAFTGRVTKPAKQSELGACLASAFGIPHSEVSPKFVKPAAVRVSGNKQYRILLVEDNLVNQEVAVGLLENLGYQADVVSDAPSALSALQEIDYKLLLTDCQLPEMDGYELTRRIRNPSVNVRNHRIPIIAVTAHSLSGDREKCLEAGMNDYLSKPLRSDELERSLNRWIQSVDPNFPSPEAASPHPETPANYVFDKNDLVDRMMGNENLARRIATVFLEAMPQQLAALADAINSFDAGATIRAAHSIKGVAANVGSAALRDLASNLEQSGEANALVSATSSLPALTETFRSVIPEIQRFCDSKQ